MWFKLRNFKGYVDSGWIKLQPLILIFGKNSSGKSAIIQGLRLINELTPQVNRYRMFRDLSVPLKGPDYDYGDFKQAVHGQDENSCIGFSFRVENNLEKNQKKHVLGNPDWMRPNQYDLHLDLNQQIDDPHVATCKSFTLDCRELFIGDSLIRLAAEICDLPFEEDESGEGDDLYNEHAAEIDGWKIENITISLDRSSERFWDVNATSSRMRPLPHSHKLFEISTASLEDIYKQISPFINSLDLPNLVWSGIDSSRRYFIDLDRGRVFVTPSQEEFDLHQMAANSEKFEKVRQKKTEPGIGSLFDFDNITEDAPDILDGREVDFTLLLKVGSDDEFSSTDHEPGAHSGLGGCPIYQ